MASKQEHSFGISYQVRTLSGERCGELYMYRTKAAAKAGLTRHFNQHYGRGNWWPVRTFLFREERPPYSQK